MDVTAHAVPEDGKVANRCIKPTLVSSKVMHIQRIKSSEL